MVTESTFNGIRLVWFEMFALHLQGPAVLQLRLDSTHTQQVTEYYVIPKSRKGSLLISCCAGVHTVY